MASDRPLIGIFDLDNTLGWKTPTYPNITPVNGDFVRYFSSLPNAQTLFATGRPRTQARVGLSKGGISPEEIYSIFSGGVFEDGLFVEDGDGEIYNALDEAPRGFRNLRKAFHSEDLKKFLVNNGYHLFSEFVIKQRMGPSGPQYELLDYAENPTGERFHWLTVDGLDVLYLQGNDVRATLKAPIGFEDDDLDRQQPFFQKLEPIVEEFMESQDPNYREYVHHVTWRDATEIYPKFDEEAFRKGYGIDMILERIDPNRDATLIFCLDGRNDISIVDHLRGTRSDYHIIMPSNADEQLQTKVNELNQEYGERGKVLTVDCTELAVGAKSYLMEKGLLG